MPLGKDMPEHVKKLVDNFPQSRAAICNAQRIDHTTENLFVERTQALFKAKKKKYVNPTWYASC